MSCPQCVGIARMFDDRVAKRELKQFRRKGPMKTTQMLIDAIRVAGAEGKSLLDIGGGVGAIQHELLKAGASSVVGVDGSSAYLAAAEEEAERLGIRDRVAYHHGDFVEVAPSIEPTDIVTLDRVLCCYDNLAQLISLSAGHATRLYGVVYPRSWPVAKLVVGIANLYMKLRKNPFRVFIHPPAEIDQLIREAGLEPRYRATTLVWNVALYERVREAAMPVVEESAEREAA